MENKRQRRTDTSSFESVAHTRGSPIEFQRKDHMTVNDGGPREKWRSLKRQPRNAIKWGQLKLLCAEMEFLTNYWDPIVHPKPIFVYVGAALGTHIAVLADLFSNVTFHLYDKQRFHECICTKEGESTKENVQIFQRYFNDEDVARYSKTESVFFSSDIRSLLFCGEHDMELTIEDVNKRNEELLWDDMLLQQTWVQAIKPVRALLKFRMPYCYQFVLAGGLTRHYLDGVLYLQPWTSQSSSETRLVPNQDYGLREWDYPAVEEMLFHHNTHLRESQVFLNPLDLSSTAVAPELGITQDWDSTCTVIISMAYLRFIGVDPTPVKVAALLNTMILGANNGRTSLVSIRNGVNAQTDKDENPDSND